MRKINSLYFPSALVDLVSYLFFFCYNFFKKISKVQNIRICTRPLFTCSKSAIETPENVVKHINNKSTERRQRHVSKLTRVGLLKF